MSTDREPDRTDRTDVAVHEVLEYLALSHVVEGELNTVAPFMGQVIRALLAAEEAAGTLTPYREQLLQTLRSTGGSATGSDAG